MLYQAPFRDGKSVKSRSFGAELAPICAPVAQVEKTSMKNTGQIHKREPKDGGKWRVCRNSSSTKFEVSLMGRAERFGRVELKRTGCRFLALSGAFCEGFITERKAAKQVLAHLEKKRYTRARADDCVRVSAHESVRIGSNANS
jgi:hypothetical protein